VKTEGTVTRREPWYRPTEDDEVIEIGYYCHFRYAAGSCEIERKFDRGFGTPFNKADEYKVGDRTVIYYNRKEPAEFIPEKCLAEPIIRHAMYGALFFAALMTGLIYLAL
jgi:hypothetical protein